MLEHEYKAQQDKLYNVRSWPVTIIAILLSALFIIGIIATLRYVGHDLFIILTTIVPMSLVALICVLTAVNGRMRRARDMVDAVVSLASIWR